MLGTNVVTVAGITQLPGHQTPWRQGVESGGCYTVSTQHGWFHDDEIESPIAVSYVVPLAAMVILYIFGPPTDDSFKVNVILMAKHLRMCFPMRLG